MSAIIKYKCSECPKLGVSLRTGFPVWSEDAPKEKCKVPVGRGNRQYVAGYTKEKACLSCKNVVEIPDAAAYAELEYGRARERWDAQNLFLKIKNLCVGIKPPQRRIVPAVVPICPECGAQDNFLTFGAKCHLCGEGEIVEDESGRWMF